VEGSPLAAFLIKVPNSFLRGPTRVIWNFPVNEGMSSDVVSVDLPLGFDGCHGAVS
jgi:hypothetical protein